MASKKTSSSAGKKKKADSRKTSAKRTSGSAKSSRQKSRSKPASSSKKTSGSRKTEGSRGSGSRSSSSSKSRKKKQASTGPFTGFFLRLVLVSLFAAVLAGGVYVWHRHAAPPAVSSIENEAGDVPKEVPRKTKQYQKRPGRAEKPGMEAEKSNAGPENPGSAPAEDRPRAAIIIDDLGNSIEMAEKFLGLDAELTCSILPHTRYQCEIAESAAKRGREVMLHLPMEPNEYPEIDPGAGALLTHMSPDERIEQLKADLEAVPHVKGVNNHMGSKMTAMFDQMNQIFTVLKKRELFFIDSLTTAASQCRSSARLFNISFAERDVFLDHVRSREAISEKIRELISVAEINGSAVAICHPYEITYKTLAAELEEIKRRLKLVPASRLVRRM